MPNWATYSVGVDGSYVYGGTNSGVGLITKSNFQHDRNWGQGTQTGNAVVEVMGDIAYIGTDGLGVLRYNITSNEWLVPFTEDNGVLDGGNDDVTGLVADIRQDMIWVGGDDGSSSSTSPTAPRFTTLNEPATSTRPTATPTA